MLRAFWLGFFVPVILAGCANPAANRSNAPASNSPNPTAVTCNVPPTDSGAEGHAQQPSGYAGPAVEGEKPTPPATAPVLLPPGVPTPPAQPSLPNGAPGALSDEYECVGGQCVLKGPTRPVDEPEPQADFRPVRVETDAPPQEQVAAMGALAAADACERIGCGGAYEFPEWLEALLVLGVIIALLAGAVWLGTRE